MNALPWAMILAAGLGTRLKPLTNYRPKPTLDFYDRPIIYHQLDMLIKIGIENVAINIHHHAEYIEKILKSYKGSINIHILYEKNILGTGGGVTNAINKLNINNDLLLIQGDIIIDYDLSKLLHLNDFVTLLCIKNKAIEEYIGNVGSDEKGLLTDLGRYYHSGRNALHKGFFTGVHFLSKEAINLLKINNLKGLVDEVYPLWLKEKKEIKALMVDNFYDDLGHPKRLLETNLSYLATRNSFISKDASIGDKVKLIEPYLINANAKIEDDAVIGPFAIVGANSLVKSKALIEKSLVMSGTIVKENERLQNVIALMDQRVVI